MNKNDFFFRVRKSPRPIIIDLWAPWCAPCRAMEPAMKDTQEKYVGKVDVMKINADDSPEVLKALGVMGIPTLVGFANGEEIVRRTGMQSAQSLDVFFHATLNQEKSVILPPSSTNRILRSLVAAALLVIGWFSGPSWWLIGIGAVFLFSAFYDRCPIYRMVAPKITAFFKQKKPADNSSQNPSN
jgi:thioredoxin